MIGFFKSLPTFSNLISIYIERILPAITKEKYNRKQLVYREGEKASKIYIVWKGEFELSRKLPKVAKTGSAIEKLLGVKKPLDANVLALHLPELPDLPMSHKL
jgi:hypothetical protein